MAEVSVCGSPGTNASVCGGTSVWKCQSVNIHRPTLRRQHQFIRTYDSQRRQTTPNLISTSVQYLPNSDLPLIWESVKT
ncbi:hypothetical protein XELAEV_18004471mg [Xenopus laevis]|uniref:Uncharacterized protein n=1 Tax=Xenopus laevis TaxID=8355 RepID=A0A974BRN4_XENLA|nr:hypothetical protein XELAEV_18004471mg [Xenopus laevis]